MSKKIKYCPVCMLDGKLKDLQEFENGDLACVITDNPWEYEYEEESHFFTVNDLTSLSAPSCYRIFRIESLYIQISEKQTIISNQEILDQVWKPGYPVCQKRYFYTRIANIKADLESLILDKPNKESILEIVNNYHMIG